MLYYFGKGTEFKKEECKEYKTLDGARKAFDKAVAAGTEATVWDEKGVVVIGMTDNVPEGALQTNPDGSVNTYDADGNKVGTVNAETVAAVTGNTGGGDSGQQENAGASTGNAGAATDSGNNDGRGNMPPEPENGQNGANTQPQQRTDTGGDDSGQQENAGASTGNAGAATDSGNNDGRGNMPPEPENGQNGANTQPQQRTDTGAGDGQQENTGAAGGDDSGQQGNVSESDTVIVPQGTMKVTVICDGTLNLRRSPHWGNTNICGRASRGQAYYVKEIHTVDGKKMVRTIDDLYLSGASEHVQFEQL